MDRKQALQLEYIKCAKSSIYTIENYFKTFDKTQNSYVPFKLFSGQKELLNNYENNKSNLVLKYRQAGISTVTAAYGAYKTAFASKDNPERILILANKQDTAIEFLAKITEFIKQLPPWLGVTISGSKKHIKLSNGSQVKAVATSPDALRGFTPTILILDEAAFIEGGQTLWTACAASLGCLDEKTIISTTRGFLELGEIIENKIDLGFHNLTKGLGVINNKGLIEYPDMGYKSDYCKTYTITTTSGRTLTGSYKHPIIVNNNKFKQMQDITVGDRVTITYNHNIFGINDKLPFDNYNESNSEILIKFISYFFLFGEITDDYVSIRCNDDFGSVLTNGILDFKPFLKIEEYGSYYVNNDKKLIAKLKSIGLNRYTIPNFILKCNKQIIKTYLEYIFKFSIKNNNLLKIKIKNVEAFRVIQTILLNFGINSNVINNVFRIHKKDYNLFYKTFNYDEFDPSTYNQVLGILTKKEKVIDIVESEGWTYDLHLPQTHTFISNGFISHNTGGNAILISTPNGLDEIYYAAYEGAITQRNNFKITHLIWWKDPRYNKDLSLVKTDDIINWMEKPKNEINEEIIKIPTENLDEGYVNKLISDGYKPISPWYKSMCLDMNMVRMKINQELECAFNGSGDNVVDVSIIQKQEKNNVTEPIYKDPVWNNNLWVWSEPIEGHRYIMGIDPSRGDSEDNTAICIIDYDTYEQVLEYQGKIPPDVAAELADNYGRKYNALITVDITGGMGLVVTTKLINDLKYPKKLIHYDNHNENVFTPIDDSSVPGINFASKNRRTLVVSSLEEALRSDFKLKSIRVIFELKKFIYINGKPNHQKGSHDDCIMALGMCLYVANNSFKNLEKNNNLTKAMIDSMSIISNNSLSNSTYLLKEALTQNIDELNQLKKDYYNTQVQEMYKEYSWLFGPTKKR